MTRWALGGAVMLVLAGAATPAGACCDWTARDTAFWQEMSENPRKFSFDLDARPSPYRMFVNDRELRVGPSREHLEADWHDVYHAIVGPSAGHADPEHPGAASPTPAATHP